MHEHLRKGGWDPSSCRFVNDDTKQSQSFEFHTYRDCGSRDEIRHGSRNWIREFGQVLKSKRERGTLLRKLFDTVNRMLFEEPYFYATPPRSIPKLYRELQMTPLRGQWHNGRDMCCPIALMDVKHGGSLDRTDPPHDELWERLNDYSNALEVSEDYILGFITGFDYPEAESAFDGLRDRCAFPTLFDAGWQDARKTISFLDVDGFTIHESEPPHRIS